MLAIVYEFLFYTVMMVLGFLAGFFLSKLGIFAVLAWVAFTFTPAGEAVVTTATHAVAMGILLTGLAILNAIQWILEKSIELTSKYSDKKSFVPLYLN